MHSQEGVLSIDGRAQDTASRVESSRLNLRQMREKLRWATRKGSSSGVRPKHLGTLQYDGLLSLVSEWKAR